MHSERDGDCVARENICKHTPGQNIVINEKPAILCVLQSEGCFVLRRMVQVSRNGHVICHIDRFFSKNL